MVRNTPSQVPPTPSSLTAHETSIHAGIVDPVEQALERGDEKGALEGLRYTEDLAAYFKKRIAETFGVSLEAAQEIMGEGRYFGPEAAEKTFGRKLSPDEIPLIPFSKADLERAQELGQFLELRVDKAGNGKRLTMQNTETLLREKFAKENRGKIFYNTHWYEGELFFTEDAPELKWVLVGKDVIPGTLNENAVVQTRVLADYLKNAVFAGQEVPAEYAAALKEFDEQEAEITELMSSNWPECGRRLAELKLNKLCRRTPAEALFDTVNHLENTREHLLPYTYDRTARPSSGALLVTIGCVDSAGAHVYNWDPRSPYPDVGVVLSRSR